MNMDKDGLNRRERRERRGGEGKIMRKGKWE
jgi:hypothetical protein